MREIEFRAWLKDEYYSVLNPENKIYRVENLDFDKNEAYLSECGWYDFDDIKLMQYTGLKDKNGVKIFEGDIVKSGKKIAVVKYGYHNCGCCHDVYGFTLVDSDVVTDAFSFDYCEVIGNIYENPDLLP